MRGERMNENRKRNLVALFYSFRRPLSSDEREREHRISFGKRKVSKKRGKERTRWWGGGMNVSYVWRVVTVYHPRKLSITHDDCTIDQESLWGWRRRENQVPFREWMNEFLLLRLLLVSFLLSFFILLEYFLFLLLTSVPSSSFCSSFALKIISKTETEREKNHAAAEEVFWIEKPS